MKKIIILLLFISTNVHSQGYIGFESGLNVNIIENNFCVKALIGRVEINTVFQVININDTKIADVVCFGGGYLLPNMITVGCGIGTMNVIPEHIILHEDRGWNREITGCLYIRKYFDIYKNLDLTVSLTAIHKAGIVLGIGLSIGYFKEEIY